MSSQVETRASPASKASKAISPAKLAHVVLRSPRYAETVQWYKTLLVARTAYANDGLTFLTYDDEHHRIAVMNIPVLIDRPGGTAGVDHIAFTYDSLNDLILTYERLKAEGIEPFWAVNHGPTTSLYYRDPDQNQVELQIENFDTDEEGDAFFASEPFSINPIGVDFDPEDYRRRLDAGESEAALKVRPVTGPRSLDTVPLR